MVAVTTMLMKPEQPISIQDEHPNCEMGKKYNFKDNKCGKLLGIIKEMEIGKFVKLLIKS